MPVVPVPILGKEAQDFPEYLRTPKIDVECVKYSPSEVFYDWNDEKSVNKANRDLAKIC